jgi:alpha-beta hydrolase superfamily lysophospholipase
LGEIPLAWTTSEFKTGDGYALKVRRYAAAGLLKGEIVCLHGVQSHAGWYEFSSTYLSQHGYNVSFIDRRGSGANMEARGDCPSFRRLVDDVAEYLTSLPRAVSRDKVVVPMPVFLSSVSWGGKIAVALERRHPGLVDGLILLCPGFFPKIRQKLGERLRVFFTRLFRPRALFPIPLNDPELFTATPRWLDFLRGDPLSLHQATARFMIESARLDAYLRFVPKYVHVPTLALLAEHDRIINNAKTREYIERFATADKTVREFPGAHHTLEFEPDPTIFLAEVLSWLDRHQRPKTLPPA